LDGAVRYGAEWDLEGAVRYGAEWVLDGAVRYGAEWDLELLSVTAQSAVFTDTTMFDFF